MEFRKIAIPVDTTGILDGHFGHCRFFSLYQVQKGDIVNHVKLQPPAHEPGLLPQWLAAQGVTDVIARGMGQKAIQLFRRFDINVYVGAPSESAKELVEKFLTQQITFDANYCDH